MVSIIVAADQNNGIGKENQLPWHLPADLKRFKNITMGHPILMGRKTFESIGKPLYGRINIVITRNKNFLTEGVIVFNSIETALKQFSNEEVFITGGEEIFRQSMQLADKIYLTRVFATFDTDTFFPEIDETQWEIIKTEQHESDEKNPYRYAFIDYQRIRS
ncbi:MAG: dihydrofolate reductase [Bacteroidia bacterium]|nr:dihydrofolate reductase [Bacteroidia bacterium]MCZ2277875.1 dihydrofolate reductase [Bacteroidia bacterium]